MLLIASSTTCLSIPATMRDHAKCGPVWNPNPKSLNHESFELLNAAETRPEQCQSFLATNLHHPKGRDIQNTRTKPKTETKNSDPRSKDSTPTTLFHPLRYFLDALEGFLGNCWDSALRTSRGVQCPWLSFLASSFFDSEQRRS